MYITGPTLWALLITSDVRWTDCRPRYSSHLSRTKRRAQ